MAAARREFARKGYAGASLRTITSQAGLTTGAFYTNFRDKRDLYLAILDELSRKLGKIVEEAIREFLEARRLQPNDNHTLDLLRAPIARVFQESLRDRDLFEILRRDGLGMDSQFQTSYRKVVQKFTDPMRKGLEDFVRAGFARPYDTEQLAQVVVILFFSVVLFASHEKKGDLQGWVETVAAMVHGGAKELSSRWPLGERDRMSPSARLERPVKVGRGTRARNGCQNGRA